MAKKPPVLRPRQNPKSSKLQPVPRRRRGDDGPDRDPTDRGTTNGQTTPSATTPDPWYPDISIHLYGLTWDLENLPAGNIRSQLSAAIAKSFPQWTFRFGFDSHYSGFDTPFSLSIGLWAGPYQDKYDAARRRGLMALRSSNKRDMSGEVVIGVPYLQDIITSAIEIRKTIPVFDFNIANGVDINLTLTLVSSSVSVVLPATFHIMANYSGWLPSLGPVGPGVDTAVTFGASAGMLTLTAPPPNTGDFGASELIKNNLFNPFGSSVLLLGGIGLGYFAISNLGSNLPALPGIGPLQLPSLASLLPSAIPLDVLKMTIVYGPPAISTRDASAGTPTGSILSPGPVVGARPGLQALGIPIVYAIVKRTPTLVVTGPSSAGLAGATAFPYHADTSDLVSPTFVWSVDGVAQAGQSAADAILTLDPKSTVVGKSKAFVIEAKSIDGLDSSLTASGTFTTYGTVIRIKPNQGEYEPPTGQGGRYSH